MQKERKWLCHRLPSWVHPDDTVFFVTICCGVRGFNSLCRNQTADVIFESIDDRTQRGIWYPFVFLLMPDHVHTVIRFNLREGSLTTIISSWKGWIRKKTGVLWQSGFFDHRLRDEESWREKADYVLLNPVRAGLVANSEDWKYVWFPDG